jgi:hypothetical protein
MEPKEQMCNEKQEKKRRLPNGSGGGQKNSEKAGSKAHHALVSAYFRYQARRIQDASTSNEMAVIVDN